MDLPETDHVGPVLLARGGDGARNRLMALVVRPENEVAPRLVPDDGNAVEGRALHRCFGFVFETFDFDLPAGRLGGYRFGDSHFRVAAPDKADLRVAYVSCNGQEEGDADRDPAERDVLWRRLRDEHRERPFGLLLQGGDQLYADDVLNCHPAVRRWWDADHRDCGGFEATDAIETAIRRFYFDRYRLILSLPAIRDLVAEVPSVMMWDDHDIVNGWGSYPATRLDSPIGRCLFAAAREFFLLFQLGARDGAMPDVMFERSGETLGCAVRYPGLSLVAPDLRSERRMDRVMAEAGWRGFETAVKATPAGDRLLVLSSVPALGPRIDLVERLADLVHLSNGWRDDLRDQWQSLAHGSEWRRFLTVCAEPQRAGRNEVGFLSGEIHLATRAELRLSEGGTIHQLIASGIAHPPPHRMSPLLLGLLARLDASPIEGGRIAMRPLPGMHRTYLAERNYLVLVRQADVWSAAWELEQSGRTSTIRF